MDEGTSSKAIPLRRARTSTRTVSVRAQGWTDGFSSGVRYVLAPPRQLWLATLGGTTITLRGARAAWAAMVAEGAVAEERLRRSLGRAPVETAPS
jgi:hypothetical protein